MKGMAAAVLGAPYSPPSPLGLHYTDNTSSIHPDRPIRPLPKRRIRSRLSSGVADSIQCPSDTSPSSTFSKAPHSESPRYHDRVPGSLPNGDARALENSDGAAKYSYQFKGNDFGSDEENVPDGLHLGQGQRPLLVDTTSSRSGHVLTRNDGMKFSKPSIPQSIASSNDSVDGYDSFENTNNKKKRKIPTSGSIGSHQSSLSVEMAQMGLSSTRDIDVSQAEADSGVGHYYGSGSSAIPAVPSGNGISGAGRGRYGRAGTRHYNGRSPLGISVNGSNTLQASRSPYYRRDGNSNGSIGFNELSSAQPHDQGIISAAIANAAALPTTPVRGKENTSLFEQQSLEKSSSAKTLFTFTCQSDSTKSMVWPEVHSPSSRWEEDAGYEPRARGTHNGRGFATQGAQPLPVTAAQPKPTSTQVATSKQQAAQEPKKPRRTLSRQYQIAARDRRMQQEYSNYHHPPKDEDIWICQFCEYESIYGKEPKQLIKDYEAKDRRERKRLAEKRRLLEKAKMKGKKEKKNNKNVKNPGTAARPLQHNQEEHYENQPVDDDLLQHEQRDVQSEEYVLDDYDEDPVSTPAPHQAPSRIPQPAFHDPHHSRRPPTGSGAVRQAPGISPKTC